MVNHMNLAAALLATTTFASNLFSSGNGLVLRAEDVLNKPYAAMVDPPTLLLSRRQNSQPPSSATSKSGSSKSTATLNPSSTATGKIEIPDGLNISDWEKNTGSACVQHLKPLTRSSDPSGTCICYNLPSLDPKTGAFEADLRVYRISEPRGEFAGVKPSEIRVGLSFSGASVSSVNKDSIMNMGMVGNVSRIAKREEEEAGPTLLHSWWFVGQIDKSEIANNLSMSALERLVMPILTLTADNDAGKKVTSNVTLNEAAFLTGVFSSDVIMSDFAAAQAAVDTQLAALKDGKVAFVLPGTQLMIFPIGLIIISVWLLVGVAIYGFGTYERMQYASMYKKRVAQSAMQVGMTRPY